MNDSKTSGFKDIRALAFDAYGTIFDVFSVTALCEELFPDNGSSLARLWRAKQLQYSLLRSLMGRHRDFWKVTEDGLIYAAESLGLDLAAGPWKRLMEAYLHLAVFPDVEPGLRTLKNKGLRLAILSNGEPRMLEEAVRNAGLSGLFDAVISAEEAGIYKPSPRVYGLGSEKLRARKGELGFVSSNSWDVNGAASAGLFTLWIRRGGEEPAEKLGFAADGVVKTIVELAGMM